MSKAAEVRVTEKLTRDACRELAALVQDAETRAHALGFTETAQALNFAKNKVGWEAVYLLNKQSAHTQEGQSK